MINLTSIEIPDDKLVSDLYLQDPMLEVGFQDPKEVFEFGYYSLIRADKV